MGTCSPYPPWGESTPGSSAAGAGFIPAMQKRDASRCRCWMLSLGSWLLLNRLPGGHWFRLSSGTRSHQTGWKMGVGSNHLCSSFQFMLPTQATRPFEQSRVRENNRSHKGISSSQHEQAPSALVLLREEPDVNQFIIFLLFSLFFPCNSEMYNFWSLLLLFTALFCLNKQTNTPVLFYGIKHFPIPE